MRHHQHCVIGSTIDLSKVLKKISVNQCNIFYHKVSEFSGGTQHYIQNASLNHSEILGLNPLFAVMTQNRAL